MNPIKWLLGPLRYQKVFGVDLDLECDCCHHTMRIRIKYQAAKRVLASTVPLVQPGHCHRCEEGHLYPVHVLRANEEGRRELEERERWVQQEQTTPTKIWYARSHFPGENPNHEVGTGGCKAALVERITPRIAVLLVEEGDRAGQRRVAVFARGHWDMTYKDAVFRTVVLTDAQRTRLDALVSD